jgi:hypothetical protein
MLLLALFIFSATSLVNSQAEEVCLSVSKPSSLCPQIKKTCTASPTGADLSDQDSNALTAANNLCNSINLQAKKLFDAMPQDERNKAALQLVR